MAAKITLMGIIPLRPNHLYDGPGIDLLDAASGGHVEWIDFPAYGDWELIDHMLASRGYVRSGEVRDEEDHLTVVVVPID